MRLSKFWEENHRTNHKGWLTGYDLYNYKRYHNALIKLNSDSVVMEVGVGLGIATAQISKVCKKLYTVDIVQEAIDKVSNISEAYLTKNFGDIEPDIMDLIICNLVLQHCNEEEARFLIEHSIRVLKSGGLFSLQTANSKGLVNLSKEFEIAGYLKMRHRDIVEAWVNEFGGTVIRDDVFNFSSEKIFWNILTITKLKDK